MSRFADWLAAGPLITDGAWGTELQKRGLAPGECPDVWNLSHPERVEAVADAYCEAGSRVILTNTFRANPVSLAGADVSAVNRAGVEISRRAARGRARVAALDRAERQSAGGGRYHGRCAGGRIRRAGAGAGGGAGRTRS